MKKKMIGREDIINPVLPQDLPLVRFFYYIGLSKNQWTVS